MMAMAAVVAGPQQLRVRAHVAVDGEKLLRGGSRSSAAWRVVGLRVTGGFGLQHNSSPSSSSSHTAPQWARVAALSEDAAVEESSSSSSSSSSLVEEQPPAAPAYEGPTVKVTFELQRECHFGQQFKVVGGDALVGDWDPTAAVTLNWSEGHVWTAQVDVPEGKKFEFKYVLTGQDGAVEWQPGANLELDAAAGSESLLISEPWESVQPEATTDWETTSSPEEDNSTSPADAVADAAASAAIGALDAGVKAATALEGVSDSVNGVPDAEETPTAVEVPVVDAALAGAAAPAPAAEEVSGESKKKKRTTSRDA